LKFIENARSSPAMGDMADIDAGTRSGSVASSDSSDLAEKLMAEKLPRAAEFSPAWLAHFPAPIFLPA
jgi:hypothetical protein